MINSKIPYIMIKNNKKYMIQTSTKLESASSIAYNWVKHGYNTGNNITSSTKLNTTSTPVFGDKVTIYKKNLYYVIIPLE